MALLLHDRDMHRSTRTFLRHYAEMVIAMLLGMAALALLSLVVDLTDRAGWELVEMGTWMTVPMVLWMRYRGHGWVATAEMAGAMVVPTAVALLLLGTRAVVDEHALLMLEHTAMFPAMLLVMLLRLDEYACHGHGLARDPAMAPEGRL